MNRNAHEEIRAVETQLGGRLDPENRAYLQGRRDELRRMIRGEYGRWEMIPGDAAKYRPDGYRARADSRRGPLVWRAEEGR